MENNETANDIISRFRQNDNRMNMIQSATEDTQVAVAALSGQIQDLTGQLMAILNAMPSKATTVTESPSDSEMVSKDSKPVSLDSEAACQDTTEPVQLDSKVVCQDTTPRGLTPKPPSTTVKKNLSQQSEFVSPSCVLDGCHEPRFMDQDGNMKQTCLHHYHLLHSNYHQPSASLSLPLTPSITNLPQSALPSASNIRGSLQSIPRSLPLYDNMSPLLTPNMNNMSNPGLSVSEFLPASTYGRGLLTNMPSISLPSVSLPTGVHTGVPQ